MDGTAQSRGGGIHVRTTERGLPLELHIDEGELSRDPITLALEILQLCRLSAGRVQVTRRRHLLDHGVSAAVVSGLRLSTIDDVEQTEAELLGLDDSASDDLAGK